jgi:predicted transcriptional regulator
LEIIKPNFSQSLKTLDKTCCEKTTEAKLKKELTNELHAFEADHVWVNQNRETLLRQYTDQWIGVKNRGVIASDWDIETLLSKLPDPTNTCIEFITSEQLEIVL